MGAKHAGSFECLESVVLTLLACLMFAGVANAGPQRDSTVTSSASGAENLKGDGAQGQELSEGGGAPYGNYCSVTIGPDKATWVQGVGRIVIFPTTVRYTRTYELKGWDKVKCDARITGCELGRWVCTASCWIRITCDAGKSKAESGDVVAQGSAELRLWIDKAAVASDVKECLVSNTCGTGAYDATDDCGVTWGICGEMTQMTDAPNVGPVPYLKGVATRICSVSYAGSVDRLNLVLEYQELARACMNVNHSDRLVNSLNHGHASVEIVHESYTPPGGTASVTNYWKVEMESWDDDDPQRPLRIHKYFFDGVSNG